MTTQLEFTPAILEELNYERFHHPVPMVQRRMEALWLKSHGLPHGQIAQLVNITENTLRDYFQLYQDGGVERLKEVAIVGPESALQEHHASLEAYFRAHPPATIKEARNKIEGLTGIKRSEAQVREFLKKNSISVVGASACSRPKPTLSSKHVSWWRSWSRAEPRPEGAKRAVFFVDAAHFVLAPFLGFLWSVTRIFLRAPAGRQRFNVLGALNAITHELVTVTNDTYMTATEVCALLRQLAALNLGVPVPVVLDNARYQRCAQVVTLAASLQIELCFLPPYSPNLNLIERLWKFVKKQCLYSTYYADFAAFRTAIVQCVAQTHTTHRTALASLLTLRFQLFTKAHFVPA